LAERAGARAICPGEAIAALRGMHSGRDPFEPNDDAAHATALHESFQNLFVAPGDDDWFEVNVTAGMPTVVWAAADGQALELTLRDAQGGLVANGTAGPGGGGVTLCGGFAAGRNLVRVAAVETAAPTRYRVAIEVGEGPYASYCPTPDTT
jgi:hypothetical protein